MPKVLIVDDDVELSALLAQYLTAEGFEALTCGSGEAALERLNHEPVDIVTLDIMMPRMNGIDVLRRLRRHRETPVLMLTARGDDVDRIAGLDLGADDYMTKPCSPGELAARLRAILRRAGAQRSAGLPRQLGALHLDAARRMASWGKRELALTGTEFSLLEMLADHPGEPVARDALSRHALGRDIAPYDRAIDVHVSSIRQKIGPFADGRSPILNVRGFGYQLITE